ncbi:hypothetical protein [Aliarcobacter butzleri]|uniref:hypothetical protein n=1 Tax=Aliarcobacter butzleri TaxID=28197 RepID=UPI0021B37544|nr:hypothetical protein [Aliarcobacter butzleri]MCT7614697.1 hypothetical protein [Aliarcobacter butzleri]
MNKINLLQTAKPIIFNTEMVKAILDGRKTQTRIPVKIKNKLTRDWALNTGVDWIKVDLKDEKYPYSIREQNGAWNEYSLKDFINKYSQYKVGDILWVRESAKILSYVDCDAHFEIVYQFLSDGKIESLTHDDLINKYKLEDHEFESKYLSKKYIEKLQKIPNGCLKEMARIFLKVTNVRVERLQDISHGNIFDEGYEYGTDYVSVEWFKNLWNSTSNNGYKWEDNPFVFVYEFEKVEVC